MLEVVIIGLIDVISEDLERPIVLNRETKYLNLVLIGDKYTFLVEFEGPTEALGSPLREIKELVLQIGPGLEQRSDWATHNHFNLKCFLLWRL